jgi:hypothetical protein
MLRSDLDTIPSVTLAEQATIRKGTLKRDERMAD